MTDTMLQDRNKLLAALKGDEGLLMFTALIWQKTERNKFSITMTDGEHPEDGEHFIPRVELKILAAASKMSKKRVRDVLDALVKVLESPDFHGVERKN